jgi:hypothetical protein
MAYLRPPAFARRVFNPLAMRFGIGGSTTLEIPRRRSGVPQRLPVIPADHAGARYLVSTRGESDWVRNLRAAGGRGVLYDDGAGRPFVATEVPVTERPPIIDAYRQKAGRTVESYWRQLPDPADHPVFRLDTPG